MARCPTCGWPIPRKPRPDQAICLAEWKSSDYGPNSGGAAVLDQTPKDYRLCVYGVPGYPKTIVFHNEERAYAAQETAVRKIRELYPEPTPSMKGEG